MKSWHRFILPLLAIVAFPAESLALDPAYRLSQYVSGHWDTSHGLPHPKVQAITQDADGYLWIGTEAGLVRFDGERFVAFAPREAQEFGSVSVRALLTGRDGSVWIGRDDGVVGRLKDGNLELYRVSDGPSPTMIRGLVEDRSGVVWVGCDEGLYRVAGRALALVLKTGVIYSLFLDADGQLWVPTEDDGVFVLRDGQQVAHFTATEGMPSGIAYGVCQRADGTIWVGTSRGTVERRKGHWVLRGSASGLPDGAVRAILTDHDDQVWAGTWSGLARWEKTRFGVLPTGEGLAEDAINALYEDREGVLWVGTRGDGLHMFRDSSAHTHTRLQGLPLSGVDAAMTDNRGRIWVIPGGGPPAVHQDGAWSTVDAGGTFRGKWARAMAEDRDGGMWFTTDRGLVCLRDGRYRTEIPPDRLDIDSIAAARRGGLWLIAEGRLYSYGPAGIVQRPYDAATIGTALKVFQERADGSVLLSTSVGLAAYRPSGSSILWKAEESDWPIETVLDDGAGNLWFAVEGHGLVRLWRDGVRHFDRHDGLPDDWVSQILMDNNGALWLGTHSGIASVPIAALLAAGSGPARLPVRLLTTRDGLKSTYAQSSGQPDAARAGDGTLWFPTTNGVVVVNPRDVVTPPPPPPVVIETIVVDGRRWSTPQVVAPPGRGDVDVEYTSPTPGTADHVRFRYRLENYDAEWQYTSRRAARYTNLPPGSYRLLVSAARSDSAWNETAVAATVVIQPRFHQTRTFFVLLALAFVGLGVGAHTLRTGRLRARARHLAVSVEQALAQVKILSGLLPICASCKRIRDEADSWKPVESYIRDNSEAKFSHSICPECMARLYPDYIESPPDKSA